LPDAVVVGGGGVGHCGVIVCLLGVESKSVVGR
jgi:hypothetical protein